MGVTKFSVIIDDEVLARDMSLDTALILAEGLLTRFCKDTEIKVTIGREGTD